MRCQNENNSSSSTERVVAVAIGGGGEEISPRFRDVPGNLLNGHVPRSPIQGITVNLFRH